MIQSCLVNRGFELIWIDEFSISGHRTKFRSWGFKGVKSTVKWLIDSLSMYFILAVLEQHIYGTIVRNKENNANVFIYFLSELIKSRNKSFKDENSKTCFIIDNASIYKTTEVKILQREDQFICLLFCHILLL